MSNIPDQIRANNLAKILDEFRTKYLQLARNSQLHGIVICDQDAKVLAVNSFFDDSINYWDIGAIGAALYGVSKQGKDFFGASDLERASLIFANTQFFVHSIGSVHVESSRTRELVLILIGSKRMNIGLAVMQMRKFAPRIKKEVETDIKTQSAMKMSEQEFFKHISELKGQIFGNM